MWSIRAGAPSSFAASGVLPAPPPAPPPASVQPEPSCGGGAGGVRGRMTGADEAGRGSELVVCVSFHGAADADDTSGACLSVSAHHSRRSYILVCLYSRINKQPHQSRPSPNEKLRHPDKRHKCLQLRLPSFAGGSASRASVATEQASAQSALVKRYGRFAAQPPTRARCRSAASSRPPIRAPPQQHPAHSE